MSEFDSPNYAEYVYERKAEGTLLLARILMITAYVLFAGAFFVVCYTVGIIPVFAICPLLLFIIWLCTWRLVSYDYYYEFKAGTLELGAVRLKKSDRRKFPKLTVHIRDVEYADEYPGDSEKLAGIKKGRASRLWWTHSLWTLTVPHPGNSCAEGSGDSRPTKFPQWKVRLKRRDQRGIQHIV